MKRKIAYAIIITAVLSSSAAYAEGKYQMIEVFLQKVGISVNGQSLNGESQAFVYQGAIYVPLRQLSELLGAEVSWDNIEKKVNLDFISDQTALIGTAAEKGVYQYLAIQHQQIVRSMTDHLKQNELEAMKQDIERLDDLRVIAEDINDESLSDAFAKLQVSAEIMRSGYASKRMEDFHLGMDIFTSTSRSINQMLENNIKAD